MIKTTLDAARNLARALNSTPVGWAISIMPDGACRADIGGTRHPEAVYRFVVQDDSRITIAQAREWLREIAASSSSLRERGQTP